MATSLGYIKIAELAKYLSRSPKTIYDAIKAGKLTKDKVALAAVLKDKKYELYIDRHKGAAKFNQEEIEAPEDPEYAAEMNRLKKDKLEAEAATKQLQYSILKGKHVDREEVLALFDTNIVKFINRISYEYKSGVKHSVYSVLGKNNKHCDRLIDEIYSQAEHIINELGNEIEKNLAKIVK